MTTAFGKILRIIRVEHDEYLKDMAAKLNITSAYLSSIENGKRNIPDGIIEKLEEIYSLPAEMKEKLAKAIYQTQNKIEISIGNMPSDRQHMAWAFARKFHELDDKQIEEFRKILEREDNK